MKRISTIIMALVLVMAMAQCKKNEETNLNKTVTITLDVKGASTGSATSGSKVLVNPATGTVDFETGDKVYVGSSGKYVGFLTHNGTNFVGNITNPTEGQQLQFYFLGNVAPQETLSAGITEECSVIISDQSEHLPVISCVASYENYVSGLTSYTGHLLNKCALVKFNVTTPSNSPICITGMKNKVTVDFTQNTMTPSVDGNGVIMLPAGSGENVEKWAILLPQEALEEGEEGTAYTENGAYLGTRGALPTIVENGYLNDGIDVNVVSIASMDHEYVDLGLPSGTLWATCNVGANAPEEYGDYFAWGETQPKDTYNWSTYQYCNGSNNTLTKYCNNSSYGYNGFTDNLTTLLPEDDAATANWGNGWRMPTSAEFEELYINTTHEWTTKNGVNGRLFTASNGNSLFLPAAGFRDDSSLHNAGSHGYYWSCSLYTDTPHKAWILRFYSSGCSMRDFNRYDGRSVRPVRSAPQNNTPIGAIDGLFTINANGDQVYFSQGNLQYQASTNTWRFAENQWDYVGDGNANISPTYDGWIDLFGWGTSGYNHGAVCYQPWSISQNNNDYYAYGNYQNNLTEYSGKANWGYNPIYNGGNQENLWRPLSQAEWIYVFNTRVTTSSIRYAKANVNNVNGVILIPDEWSISTYSLNNTNSMDASFSSNTLNASQWGTLEQAGAVFLPAAGSRFGTLVSNSVGSYGNYWSASYQDRNFAFYVYFLNTTIAPEFGSYRYTGLSVRLAQNYNP